MTMINATDKIITDLLAAWHEAGRQSFHGNSDSYDTAYAKSAKPGRKYINLDNGTSGVFMVDRVTGEIYGIKGYGKIDKRKFIGTIQTVTGTYLAIDRRS